MTENKRLLQRKSPTERISSCQPSSEPASGTWSNRTTHLRRYQHSHTSRLSNTVSCRRTLSREEGSTQHFLSFPWSWDKALHQHDPCARQHGRTPALRPSFFGLERVPSLQQGTTLLPHISAATACTYTSALFHCHVRRCPVRCYSF